MARCAARATRTGSPPRWTGSTSPIRRRSSGAPAGPSRCRASSAGSGAGTRSRCATSSSCAPTPTRTIKITLPGPFTLSRQAKNEFYDDEEELALDFAAAVNAEAHDLKSAGADVIQLDEPWVEAAPELAARYALKALERALAGVPGPTALHLCFGYAQLVHDKCKASYAFLEPLADSTVEQVSIEAAQPKLDLGVLQRVLAPDHHPRRARPRRAGGRESAEEVAARIRQALAHVPAERLVAAPDCGMKYLAREVAFGKLQALARGAALVRAELASADGQR